MGRLTVAAIVSIWVVPISILVNRVVPDPYMDEIFHIPQAQKYCHGDLWSWDPMITTPPGLYYLSLVWNGILYPVMRNAGYASSFSSSCSVAFLRSINGMLAVVCSILTFDIFKCLRPAMDDRRPTLFAVILALYPLQWFFAFLYYTDTASVALVLAMYLSCLRKRYWFSSLLGALALFTRQTNIVWVLFAACSEVMNITLGSKRDDARLTEAYVQAPVTSQVVDQSDKPKSALRKRIAGGAEETVKHVRPTSNIPSAQRSGFLNEIEDLIFTSWKMKWEIIVQFFPFALVLVAFLAFVRWNGGIVLGAKDAHTVSPHFAQMMYFGLISSLATAPFHYSLSQAAGLFRAFLQNRLVFALQAFLVCIVGFLSVHFFSIAHPYLLADNRHYTFYLWRKIIHRHWSLKYLLVLPYAYSWMSIISSLKKSQKGLWILAYILATCAVLVPAPLIEFRYYTLPFYFLVLHSHIEKDRDWILIGLQYVVVNIFTMTMFLFCPFKWDHEPGTQRFIW
ncbi:hypothetical protein MLD38_020277 [Melastoma candidum]|uniref:Uncharacterized protein n=1 Tax=Melastoma candidum TaxID=119954 RepID=A0ACB9QFG0_9MYRT|nr:hypothetical protein MLD38_020277 [Melastoma candidum]